MRLRTLAMAASLIGIVLAAPGRAADLAAGRKEGQKQLEKLNPIESTINTYHEIQIGGRAIGCAEVSIEPKTINGGKFYLYRHVVNVKIPGGVAMTAIMEGAVDEKFSPVEMKSSRTITGDEGEKFTAEQSAQARPDRIIVAWNTDGKMSTKELKTPEGPLVFGVDVLVQRLDPEQRTPFVLRQLDLENGEPIDLHFSWGTAPDKKPRLFVSKDGIEPDEYFDFEEGTLVSYGKVDPPMIERKVSKKQFDEVKKLLGIK